MFLGLTIITYVSTGPVLKALMMAALGLTLATIGSKINLRLTAFERWKRIPPGWNPVGADGNGSFWNFGSFVEFGKNLKSRNLWKKT